MSRHLIISFTNRIRARHPTVGDFCWGYGSGLVAFQIPGWGEFVLADLTQPFDQHDASYLPPSSPTWNAAWATDRSEVVLDRAIKFGPED